MLKTSIASFLTNPEDWQNTTKECAVSSLIRKTLFFSPPLDVKYFLLNCFMSIYVVILIIFETGQYFVIRSNTCAVFI